MLGLIIFKQEVMLKKTLFFILFFIITTSAFAKTFNQKFQDGADLYNSKKYEEALSVFLRLEMRWDNNFSGDMSKKDIIVP